VPNPGLCAGRRVHVAAENWIEPPLTAQLEFRFSLISEQIHVRRAAVGLRHSPLFSMSRGLFAA
jgi:hypothetical protein